MQCPSHAVVAKRVRGLWIRFFFFYYFWVFQRGRWPHPFFDPPQLRSSVLSPYDRLLFDINYIFQAIFDPFFFLGQRPSCYSHPSPSRLLGQHRRHIAYTLVFPYRTLSTMGVFYLFCLLHWNQRRRFHFLGYPSVVLNFHFVHLPRHRMRYFDDSTMFGYTILIKKKKINKLIQKQMYNTCIK